MIQDRKIHVVILGIVCFFTFFIHNRVIYPDIMESRNLITAREMVQYDNWLVPTMNGVLRLEKPPLPTWIAAGVEMISPDNVSLQRTAAGIVATLLVFFLYFLAETLTRNRLYGLIASLVLCTSFNIILMGRTASWDIYCHSFMLGAIYFLYRAFEKPGPCWKEFIGAGIWMGLSFLGKGPVSFYALLLPFLISYFIFYRPSFRGKWGPLGVLVLICLLISLWWPAYLYLYHRDMALFVAAKETTAWMERNVRPWYYYWKFFLESGIWSLFLVTALIWPYWKKRLKYKKEYLFTVVWTFSVLILLSVLPEKKTRYLLPILIPAALVVAHLFLYWTERVRKGGLAGWDKIGFRVNTFLVASVALAIPVGVYVLFYAEGYMSTGRLIGVIVLLAGVIYLLFRSALKMRPLQFLAAVVGLFLTVEIALMPCIANLFNNLERKSIRAVRTIEAVEGLPFYYNADEELRIELVYEAGRRILPWNIRQDTLPLAHLPIVLVSEKPAAETLPPAILEKVNLRLIDKYDDNRRQKDTKRYSGLFIRYVTVLEKK